MPQTKTIAHTLAIATGLTDTTPASLPPATAGVPYSFQFTATGGLAPYTWTNATGMPAGLTLSPSGLLSGTPTVNGNFTIFCDLKDSSP